MVSYDERKRRSNLRDHGIDLADCDEVFEGPHITREDTREAYGEQRFQTFGMLKGRVVCALWTPHGESERMISCREAEKHEARRFWKAISY